MLQFLIEKKLYDFLRGFEIIYAVLGECPIIQRSLFDQGKLKGKYHCIVDLLFDRFGNVCPCSKKFSAPSTNTHFQTSQTGGQPYSDTSPSEFLVVGMIHPQMDTYTRS